MTSEDVTAPNLNFIEDDLAAAVDEDPLDDGELYQDDDDNNLFSDSRHPPKGKYTFVSRHPDHQETIPSKLSLQGGINCEFQFAVNIPWRETQHVLHSSITAEFWGTRHTFILMSFLGFANIYAMRVNLSVAIVAMVKGMHHILALTSVH